MAEKDLSHVPCQQECKAQLDIVYKSSDTILSATVLSLLLSSLHLTDHQDLGVGSEGQEGRGRPGFSYIVQT